MNRRIHRLHKPKSHASYASHSVQNKNKTKHRDQEEEVEEEKKN